MIIRLNKKQWEETGRKAGWLDALKMVTDPLAKKVKKVLEPDNSANVIRNYEEDNSYELTEHLNEQQIMAKPSKDIDIDRVNSQFVSKHNITDANLLKAFPRAVEYIKNPPSGTNPQTIGGLKVLLYRIMNIEDEAKKKQFIEILNKWYANRRQMDGIWEKPTRSI